MMKLFSKPDCAPCEQLKGFLAREGIPYEEYDVMNPANDKLVSRYGIMSVPTLLTDNGKRYVGFNARIAKDIEAIINDD